MVSLLKGPHGGTFTQEGGLGEELHRKINAWSLACVFSSCGI